MQLATPIEEVPRVGPQYQKKLKKLGIKTIHDLLFHFPHRYEEFSNIVPVSEIKSGAINSIQGKILEIENKRTWKKRMVLTQCLVEDFSGAIKVIWFNQPYLINVLKKGDFISLSGKAVLKKNEIYLSSPAYEKISSLADFQGINPNKTKTTKKEKGLTHTGRLIPVYPETEGLSSKWLRYVIKLVLTDLGDKILDPLPIKLRKEHQLILLQKSLWQAHFPDSLILAKKAKKRFAFEGLFFIGLHILREKQKLAKEKAMPIPFDLKLIQGFVKKLPFKLTGCQKKSIWQILKDIERPWPMNRLLEGDVGSGKTVVATMAILNIVKAGYQTGLMAPTEILAKQHFQEISKLLKSFNLSIGLLTGKEGKIISKESKWQAIKISRQKLLEKIIAGETDLLIGTHALIQKQVKFKRLALVVLDEQHRFGVDQRARLCSSPAKASTNRQEKELPPIPHLLSMTATPIPRTLALTIYGDLDLSLIVELPKGRKKIITKIIPPKERNKAYRFIKNEVKQGRQVFVICPRIEPTNNERQTANNEQLLKWNEVKAVKEEYTKLSKKIFPDLKIGMLHGKMKTEEKEEIMRKFKQKETDILVSTSVIEVGIDIPNAGVMMIEGAERFGLAQLHQFRGRVGRAEHQSFCFLFTDSPAKKTFQRLKALMFSENGFDLAEQDLKIRGPGEVFGQRQSGIPDLVMDSLADISLVTKTRQAAKEILIEDPGLKKYPLLREKIQEFEKKVHLE